MKKSYSRSVHLLKQEKKKNAPLKIATNFVTTEKGSLNHSISYNSRSI